MPRMDPFDMTRLQLRWLTGWRAMLLAALAAAVVLSLLIVATTLVLIITPVALAALLAHRFLSRRAARRDARDAAGRLPAIDVDYEVIVADSPADRGPPEPGAERPRPE